jgi:hypothetical protein
MTEDIFTGYVDFHLKLSTLGTSTTRTIRANYRYTPDWPYLDPMTGLETTSPSSAIEIDFQFQLLPPKHGFRGLSISPDDPCWIDGGPIVMLATASRRASEKLDAIIDADARWRDQERRHQADPSFPAPGPRL